MRKPLALCALTALLLLSATLAAASPALTAADEEAAARNPRYRSGRTALDEERWSDAVAAFDQVIAEAGSDADAALYWKAYALHKLDRDGDALVALSRLGQDYPQSPWIDDARALTVEIRPRRAETLKFHDRIRDTRHPRYSHRGSEQPAEVDEEEEIKLVALTALMNSDSQRATEMLEKLLDDDSARLRERALFVLGQSDSPRAFEILAAAAKGEKRPDLREPALRMLGLSDSPAAGAVLREIYASTSDADLKEAILEGFMHSDDIDAVLQVLADEKDPELRLAAIRMLGHMDAIDELTELYRKETSLEVRKEIVRGFFLADAVDNLVEVARSDADEVLRLEAIRGLGLVGSAAALKAARSFYSADADAAVRMAVVDALFMEDDAEGLIEIARQETDPEVRRHVIRQLSHIDSDEALDFLMEILEE